jgi:predicted nucleic acid-binding protein
MSAKPFFDTNVLIYSVHTGDRRSETAQALLASGGIISVQSLQEFVSVARRKLAMSWGEVREALAAIETLCPLPRAITVATSKRALQIAERYGYHIFDSLILASALEANCTTVYSEDLHRGQVIEGLTLENPFAHSS